MKVCKLCTEQYDDKFKFCPQCGQLLEDEVTRKCSNCGYILGDKMFFCPECGTSVGDNVVSNEADYSSQQTVNQPTTMENNYKRDVVNEKIALLSKKQWYFIIVIMVVSWISKKGNAITAARKGYRNIGSFDITMAALVDVFSFVYCLIVYNLIREEYKCGNKKKMWIYIFGSIVGFCIWALLRAEFLRMLRMG